MNLKWGQPYLLIVGYSKQYRRDCFISEEISEDFLKYWNTNLVTLKLKGFDIIKKSKGWILRETKNSQSDFDATPNNAPKESEQSYVSTYELVHKDGLRPWQIDAVSKHVSVINSLGSSVDGSDMGVGKTFSSLGVARELDVPFIIVCPKAVVNQWQTVVDKHFKLTDKCKGIINYELLIRGRKDSNIASFVKDRKTRRNKFTWKLPKGSLIIYDEAHKLKNFKTQASKTCIDAFNSGYKMLFLSATVAVNPIELRTIGTCLKLFKGANQYYEWLGAHGCTKGIWSWEFNDDKNVLNKLNKVLFENRGVRLRRDLIPNFPETEIIVNAYDLDEEKTDLINKEYKAMYEQIKKLNKLIDKGLNELTIRLRHRQKIELLKTDLFKQLAEEGLESGMSVIIFVNYSETINILSKILGTTCIYDGKVGDITRNANFKAFQENRERLMLVNIKAGNVGLNMPDLDGNHPRLTLISPDDSAVAIKQVTGRAVRENSKSKTLQKIVFVNNTIEAKVVDNVLNKINNLDTLNDGDLNI